MGMQVYPTMIEHTVTHHKVQIEPDFDSPYHALENHLRAANVQPVTVANVAAQALMKLGVHAKSAIPKLRQLLEEGGCSQPSEVRDVLNSLWPTE